MALRTSRAAAKSAPTWLPTSIAVGLLAVAAWAAFAVSPWLLLSLIALFSSSAVFVTRWLAKLEASVLQHARSASAENPHSHPATVDDGARAFVEGAAFQSIVTSLVYAYCTPYGSNVIKSRINDQLRSSDVAIEELRFGSHIPQTTVLSQPSMQRGELHLSLSIEWDLSDGAVRLLLRRFNIQIEVRMSKVQLQGTVVVASTKAPWEVRYHASPPVFVDLRPSVALGQLPSIHLDRFTPIASRCLLIATAPFLRGRYAHQWSDALGLEQLLAWSAEKLPRTSLTEPLFPILKELATHPSFPYGANAQRFKARQEFIASSALAAFDTLKIAKRFIEDKIVQTPQELLNVVKAADKCLLACLTASDETQVLSFFPQPSQVSELVLPLYRLLGLSPILAEALSGIERRATTQSVSFPHGDGTQEGSFVLLRPRPSEELPKVRHFQAPPVNLSQAVARTLLQSAAQPALYLCAAGESVNFAATAPEAATVWLVLFQDLTLRSFLLVAEGAEAFLCVRDGALALSRHDRGAWFWVDRRASAEILASFSTEPEGEGVLISSAEPGALEAAPASKESWLRFVDCPPPPVVQQEP